MDSAYIDAERMSINFEGRVVAGIPVACGARPSKLVCDTMAQARRREP